MDYYRILEKLKQSGKITEEDIKEADSEVDSAVMNLSATLHSLVCMKEKHVSLEEFTLGIVGCSFYAEETTMNSWELPEHKRWLKIATIMREMLPEIVEEPMNVIDIATTLSCMQDDRVRMFVEKALSLIQQEI